MNGNEKAITKFLCKNINESMKKVGSSPFRWCQHLFSLPTSKFGSIWERWRGTETSPLLEVDLVLVYNDILRYPDEALIIATELKYYNSSLVNFYDGVQQALAFSLFGFNGTFLLHLFPAQTSDDLITKFTDATSELISGLELPLLYVACRIDRQKLTCFTPVELAGKLYIDQLIDFILEKFSKKRNRNPILTENNYKVLQRREVLKIALKIPATRE